MVIINGHLCEKLPRFIGLFEAKQNHGICFGYCGRVYRQGTKLDPATVEILVAGGYVERK